MRRFSARELKASKLMVAFSKIISALEGVFHGYDEMGAGTQTEENIADIILVSDCLWRTIWRLNNLLFPV